jgi:hypothetical protein
VGLLDTISNNPDYNIIKVFGTTPRNRISAGDFRMVANTLTNDIKDRFGGQYNWSKIHPAIIASKLYDLVQYRPDLVTPGIQQNIHDYLAFMETQSQRSNSQFQHILDSDDGGLNREIQKTHYLMGKYAPDVQAKITEQMGYWTFRDMPEDSLSSQEAANNYYKYLVTEQDFPSEGLDNIVNHFPSQFVTKEMIDDYLVRLPSDNDRIEALQLVVMNGNNENNRFLRYCYQLLQRYGNQHFADAVKDKDDYQARLSAHNQKIKQNYSGDRSTDDDQTTDDNIEKIDPRVSAELERIRKNSGLT